MPGSAFGSIGCPVDLDHIDMDDDGDVEFLVTLRTLPGFCSGDTSEVRVFTNTGSGVFAAPTILNSRADNSTHDAFWIDADHDGQYDIIFANEWNNADNNADDVRCQLLLNDGAGGFAQNRTFNIAASAGDVGDFNGDGLMDFVLGRTEVRVFLTRSNSPCLTNPSNQCTYDEVVVMADDGTNNPFYDFEIGDVDLDGFVDIVGARIRPSANNVPIWINNGSGTVFNDITGGTSSSVLPGNGSYQRLSAELIDFDLDGDLDLYVTGQDTSDDAPGSDVGLGRGPNQFFENLLIGLDIVSPRQAHRPTPDRPRGVGKCSSGYATICRSPGLLRPTSSLRSTAHRWIRRPR